MFGFMALGMLKEGELAYKQLMKLIPITHDFISTSPFVMPNSYGYNPELGIDGQSMNDWYTGSSNTLLKGLVESFIGVYPLFENKIMIEPNRLPIDEINLEITIKHKRIKYHQISNKSNKPVISINGQIQNSNEINLEEYKDRTLNIEVQY